MHESNSHIDNEISQPFTLGKLLVSPSHNQIEIDNRVIKVQPKAMSVLAYLAKHSERVISSEELIDTLWTGRIVTQNSVQKSINTLRKLLADYFVEQTVIENYSKKGYQLKIIPIFLAVTQENVAETKPFLPLITPNKIGSILGVLVFIAVVYFYQQQLSNNINRNKQHQLNFNQVTKYIADKNHASSGEPHPNNQDIVYVHTQVNDSQTSTNQILLIRNKQQQDWRIASTQGKWVHTVWSPDGKHLVAIEQQSAELQPTTASFYGLNIFSYTFHIFTLDVTRQKLVEKQLLSQWHGQVNSVTWINNNQFEFVASQGDNPLFQRYRYVPDEQHLNIESPLDFAPLPFSSVALNGQMALLSDYKNGKRIDFIDNKQQLISSWPVDTNSTQLSWIPDGTGVLIYKAGNTEINVLYLDGEQQVISLPNINTYADLHPRFSADGQKLIFTGNHSTNAILLEAANGLKTTLIDKSMYHYGATFSPDAKQFVYVSSNKNKTQLWLKLNNQEALLLDKSLTEPITDLIWPKQSFIIYKMGSHIYQFNFASSSKQLLLADAANITPIAFSPDTNLMTTLVKVTNTKNVWSFDLNQNTRKQLTFGSIGSATLKQQKVYFQYVGQQGLWVMDRKNSKIEQHTENLQPNSKLLSMDESGVYYINGSICQESDIFYQQFDSEDRITFLPRANKNTQTSDFNHQKGALTTQCQLGKSNIMRYE